MGHFTRLKQARFLAKETDTNPDNSHNELNNNYTICSKQNKHNQAAYTEDVKVYKKLSWQSLRKYLSPASLVI